MKLRKFLCVGLILVMVLSMSVTSFASSFSDLPSSHWASGNIEKMVAEGYFSGYPDGSFKPNNTITYGEFISLIARICYPDKYASYVERFKEEGEPWYYAGYHTLLNSRGKFRGDDYYRLSYDKADTPIPREFMSMLVAEAIYVVDGGSDKVSVASAYDIVDLDDAGSSYWGAIRLAYGSGLIGGYSDGSFKPHGTLTRAEASTVLYRLIEPSARLDY